MNKLKIKLSNKLSLEDLSYLNQLLQASIPLKGALELIETTKNKKIIKKIILDLDQGLMIEEVFPLFVDKEAADYLKCLLKNLSFKDSLSLSLAFLNKNKENIKMITKNILYPIGLLFLALSALFLFDQYGLDTIINLMKSFSTNLDSILLIRIVLRVIIYLFYFCLILVLLIILFFVNKKRITIFYILLAKYFPHSLVKTYFTQDFMSLFLVTMDLGYKTKESLEILKALFNKPLVSFLAYHLDDLLLSGHSLKEAAQQKYYDETLWKFINIASYSKDFKALLKNYLTYAEERMQNKLKRLTTALQLMSYFGIGLVIVFIYQILFLPMQALGSF